MTSRIVMRLSRSQKIRCAAFSTAVHNEVSQSTVGQLYQIENDTAKQLNLASHLPSTLSKQMETLGELVTLVRNPLIEVTSCMRVVEPSLPALRLVLWGPFGTGKSVTLNQAVHQAHKQNWVVLHVRTAMEFTRRVQEVEMSSYVPGRINDPVNAVAILQNFKHQNQNVWKTLAELKTERDYEWSKSEKTLAEKPITDIVEMGLSAPYLATDCVGALFREIRRHSTSGSIKVLVAFDDANSLWGKTLVKRADRTLAPPSDLSLVVHLRKMLTNEWTNGCVLLVADKKENSDATDELAVPRNTPLELFGEEGFEHIDPFIPIETNVYTEQEADNLYEYYLNKKWLTTKAAQTDDGKQQLKHLSAFNPYYYERLCAFN